MTKESTLKSLNKVIEHKPINEKERLYLTQNGLIERVSWSQYVITKNGNKLINILS